MAQFQSGKSLYYMLFANQDDVYTEDTMLTFNSTNDYLEYTLKKEGFKNIIRWEGGDCFRPVTRNDTCMKICSQKSKSLFDKKIKSIRGKLESIVKCPERSALIVDIAVFSSMCDEKFVMDSTLISELKEKACGSNIIVITAWGGAEKNAKYFIDPSCPIANVFNTVGRKISLSAEKDLFTMIKDEYGEIIIFWNIPTKEEIRNILVKVFLHRSGSDALITSIDKLCVFISHFYQSTALRNFYPYSWTMEKPISVRRDVEETLLFSNEGCNRIIEWINKRYGNTGADALAEYLKSEFRTDNYVCPLYIQDSMLLSPWNNVKKLIRFSSYEINNSIKNIDRMVIAVSSYGVLNLPGYVGKNDLFRKVCEDSIFTEDKTEDEYITSVALFAIETVLSNFFRFFKVGTDTVNIDEYCDLIASFVGSYNKIEKNIVAYLEQIDSDTIKISGVSDELAKRFRQRVNERTGYVADKQIIDMAKSIGIKKDDVIAMMINANSICNMLDETRRAIMNKSINDPEIREKIVSHLKEIKDESLNPAAITIWDDSRNADASGIDIEPELVIPNVEDVIDAEPVIAQQPDENKTQNNFGHQPDFIIPDNISGSDYVSPFENREKNEFSFGINPEDIIPVDKRNDFVNEFGNKDENDFPFNGNDYMTKFDI